MEQRMKREWEIGGAEDKSYPLEHRLEHVVGENIKALSRVLHALQARVVAEQIVEDVQEEAQRELVEEMNLCEGLHSEVQPAARLSNWCVDFSNTKHLKDIKDRFV